MRNRNWFSLMAAVVLFATCQASAAVFDHFNNGQLDPAWGVTFQNATGWSYTESGTELVVSDIEMVTGPPNGVTLKRDFFAPGDFEIKSGLSWDSLSSSSTIQTIDVRVYSGGALAVQGGYTDPMLYSAGRRYGRIEGLKYIYDGGYQAYSGTAGITLKRVNGFVSVLWNDNVILSAYSDLPIDKVGLFFGGEYSYDYGKLSVDYVTAVPEPATILLLGLGGLALLRKRRA
jgi:hypothetical protein